MTVNLFGSAPRRVGATAVRAARREMMAVLVNILRLKEMRLWVCFALLCSALKLLFQLVDEGVLGAMSRLYIYSSFLGRSTGKGPTRRAWSIL